MPRVLRDRGGARHGHRYVDDNFDVKRELSENNGGTMPDTPAFTTSDFPGSTTWTDENPPDILFYLQPPPSQYEGREPQCVVDEHGKQVMSPYVKKQELRAIPVLPDRISIDVPAWMMVAWRRLDPRISLQDIVDRMTTDLGDAETLTTRRVVLPKKNIIQNHCTRRCRKLLCYYNDYGRRSEPHRAEVEAIESLTMNNIRYNTVLPLHPVFNRLIKLQFARRIEDGLVYVRPMTVTEDNLEQTTYPLDHFHVEGYEPHLSESMSKAMCTLWAIQEKAVKHGMDPLKWDKLPKSCLPRSWFDRTSMKDSDDADDTYDGGCPVCTYVPSEDDRLSLPAMDESDQKHECLNGFNVKNEAEQVKEDTNPWDSSEVGSGSSFWSGTPSTPEGVQEDHASSSLKPLTKKRKAAAATPVTPKRQARHCHADHTRPTEQSNDDHGEIEANNPEQSILSDAAWYQESQEYLNIDPITPAGQVSNYFHWTGDRYMPFDTDPPIPAAPNPNRFEPLSPEYLESTLQSSLDSFASSFASLNDGLPPGSFNWQGQMSSSSLQHDTNIQPQLLMHDPMLSDTTNPESYGDGNLYDFMFEPIQSLLASDNGIPAAGVG